MSDTRTPSRGELLDWLSVAQSKHDVEAAIQWFAEGHGFSWFTYLKVRDGDVLGISTYPHEWQNSYLRNQLGLIDPIVRRALGSFDVFPWGGWNDHPGLQRDQARFMRAAAEFGICSGVTVPIEGGHGTKEMLTFAASDRCCDVHELEPDSALRIGLFVQGVLGRIETKELRGRDCPLTPSQLNCLEWLAEGKTSAEVAIIKGVSTRAIEYLLHGARQRLDAQTALQTAVIASNRGWIQT